MAQRFGPHVEKPLAVALSGNGSLLALGGERDAPGLSSSKVHVLTWPKLEPRCAIPFDAAVRALCFAGDDLLVVGTAGGDVGIVDARSGSVVPLVVEPAHDGGVNAVAPHADGVRIATVGDDGVLHVFEIARSEERTTVREHRRVKLSSRPLRAVAIESERGVVVAGGDDGVARSVSLTDEGGEPREMSLSDAGVRALALTGDGRVAAGCGDGSLRLCYLEGAVDPEDRSGDNGHERAVVSLQLGPQLTDEADRPLPRRLFSASEDGAIKAWLIDSRRKPRTVELGAAALRAMTWTQAREGAGSAQAGGTLVLVNDRRELVLLAVNDKSEPADSAERVPGELERLAGDLRASNDKVRIAAVRALGKLPEDDARVLLDGVLASDGSTTVRKTAAEVLGLGGRRRSRPALRTALNDGDDGVRGAALSALTKIEDNAPLSPVRAALGSAHADIRKRAIERLPGLRDVSPLVPTLLAATLNDGDAEVRTLALDALYTLEGDGSLAPVRTALDRGPTDIRITALLRMVRDGRATEGEGRTLLESALDDADATVRRTAFQIAVASRSRLAATLREADEGFAKALAELESEGSLGDGASGAITEEDLQPVFAALASRSADTALRGARTLALIGDSRAIGALLQLSREADAGVRRQVVEALAVADRSMPGDVRVVGRLEWLLDDENAEVRAAALQILLELGQRAGPKGHLDAAEVALRTAFDGIRVRALQILVQFGGQGEHAGHAELARRADALLGDALDDEAVNVRSEAFRTLWAWHTENPRVPLERGAVSRHPDIRQRVVAEVARLDPEQNDWVEALLVSMIGDADAGVGLSAYYRLTDREAYETRADIHLAALGSPRPSVRAEGCRRARKADPAPLRDRIAELVSDENPEVHLAAIEAIDALVPDDMFAFTTAFNSMFYELRVRAGELCGRRRDKRCVEPMKKLLTIPPHHPERPADVLRQRAARALADVGIPAAIPFYVGLLDDEDGVVREMGARGLATACAPGQEQPLVDALNHGDLAVRSWAAEGLARLGDARALPILFGTIRHEHPPIRRGAVIGFVALGADGMRGMLQGLEDTDRNVQDLVLSVIGARDVALARAGLPPDLLLSALSSFHPEIRFAATRFLEERTEGQPTDGAIQSLVAPPRPERAADMKDWPDEGERPRIINVLINAVASDDPTHRYAAAQVLALRQQPLAYWREAERLVAASRGETRWVPHTNWADEAKEPRKKDWIRRLFGTAAPEQTGPVLVEAGAPRGDAGEAGEIHRLAFGTYAGLVRQAPPEGEADETHRVRRDAIARVAVLARQPTVGREAALPVLRRALSDPHHLVRRAASTAIAELYPEDSLEPLALALQSSAADVGRSAVEQLVALAEQGNAAARELALGSINAPNRDVRAHALTQIQKLFEADSLEPWLVALESRYGDLRSLVVDRLMESPDARVGDALVRALESDHEDLRLKAALALANRGDVRTVDVLAGFLRSEQGGYVAKALDALVAVAHAPGDGTQRQSRAEAAAVAVAARIEDDPDQTADRHALMRALSRIGHPAAAEVLLAQLADPEPANRNAAFDALKEVARDAERGVRTATDGTRRLALDDARALEYAAAAAASDDASLRMRAIEILRDVDEGAAESMLARLIDDREESVRVAACTAVAFRAEYVIGATIDPLVSALRAGRRELVLPSAEGMARRGRPEAFQPLMLVFKAGEPSERIRAVRALGELGDRRALEELEPLVDPRSEIPDEDRFLAPAAAEALGSMLPQLEDPDDQVRVRETVESLAHTGDYTVQLGALSGLRHAGDERSRGILERIAADRYGNANLRMHAVKELGELSNPASESVLGDVLSDPNYSLRHAALQALTRIFPEAATRTALLSLQSPYRDISEPAAAYLAQHGEASALLRRLSEVRDAGVRTRLRQGLVRRAAAPAAEVESLLLGAHVEARTEAAWIAGASANEALAAPVLKALQTTRQEWLQARPRVDAHERRALLERTWHALLWAARRLGVQGGDEARGALAESEAPVPVRVEAIRLLGEQGTVSDEPVLRAQLTHGDSSVRAAAASAIARIAPSVAPTVLESLRVADTGTLTPVAEKAMQARGAELLSEDSTRRAVLPVALRPQRVDDLARVAQQSGESQARLTALLGLGRVGGERAEQTLRAVLGGEGEPEKVRVTASRALKRLRRQAARAAERGGE